VDIGIDLRYDTGSEQGQPRCLWVKVSELEPDVPRIHICVPE